MSTTLRFRPRQGEKKVEDSLVQERQATLDVASSYLRGIVSRYTSHLVVVVVAVLVFAMGPLDLRLEYDFPPCNPHRRPGFWFSSEFPLAERPWWTP